MNESKFKKGEVVVHKATDRFEMVIVENAFYENPTMRQLSNKERNPERYICRYYNLDNKLWEEKNFYEWELESAETSD